MSYRIIWWRIHIIINKHILLSFPYCVYHKKGCHNMPISTYNSDLSKQILKQGRDTTRSCVLRFFLFCLMCARTALKRIQPSTFCYRRLCRNWATVFADPSHPLQSCIINSWMGWLHRCEKGFKSAWNYETQCMRLWLFVLICILPAASHFASNLCADEIVIKKHASCININQKPLKSWLK